MLTRSLVEAAEPWLANMTDALKTQAKKIYILLVTSAKVMALGLLRGVETFNGFEAWRRLEEYYEPDVASRHANMLCGLLTPDWSG